MGVIMGAINDITKIAAVLIFIGFIIGLAVGHTIANPSPNNYTTTQSSTDSPVQQPTAEIGGCSMTDMEAEALKNYNKLLSDDNMRLNNLVISKEGTISHLNGEIDSLNAEIGRLKYEIEVMKEAYIK